MVVGEERSGGSGSVDGFVVPDCGGEREQALQDSGADAWFGSCAVAFEIELGFQGLVDRLDDLTERSQESLVGPRLLGSERGANERHASSGEFGFEAGAPVALVADEDLAGSVEFGVESDMSSAVSRSSVLAPASACATGSPDGVVIR